VVIPAGVRVLLYCKLFEESFLPVERDEDIAQKTSIKYTFAYIVFPTILKSREPTVWCPKQA
jgi:hypothetical protein